MNEPTVLREEDLRPDRLMTGQRVAMLTDVGRLLGRRGEFVAVPCPACGAEDAAPVWYKYGLEYQQCRRCHSQYISPRPPPEVLEWFYRGSVNYAYWNQHIFPASEASRRERIVRPRVDHVLDLCQRHGIATGGLLEVGAAFGTFCAELQERNVFGRIVGVEPTPDLAATCRNRGIAVIEKPIERVAIPDAERFDVVVAFEVIEHLFDPGAFVASCRRLIRPGGMLVLTCPNGLGFDVTVLGERSVAVDHEHLNYFNPASLRLLLKNHGFACLSCETRGRLDAELVRKAVLAGECDLDHQPFLRTVLLERWDELGTRFQDFIAASGLSSNMWLAARLPTA